MYFILPFGLNLSYCFPQVFFFFRVHGGTVDNGQNFGMLNFFKFGLFFQVFFVDLFQLLLGVFES